MRIVKSLFRKQLDNITKRLEDAMGDFTFAVYWGKYGFILSFIVANFSYGKTLNDMHFLFITLFVTSIFYNIYYVSLLRKIYLILNLLIFITPFSIT